MKMSYKRESAEPTAEEAKELEGLAGRPIDTSDIPEQLEWRGAGQVLSAGEAGSEPAAGCGCDRVAEEDGQGYQTRVNRMLRKRMLEELRRE